MTEQSDWATQLSAAIQSQFGARPRRVELYSVRAVSPDVVEIIHSDPGGRGVRGIRIDRTSVLSARERINDSSIVKLAFDLVCIGMEEPKPEEDFSRLTSTESRGYGWIGGSTRTPRRRIADYFAISLRWSRLGSARFLDVLR